MNKLLRLLGKRHQPDTEALSALIDGRLDAARAATVEEHTTSCAACSTALGEMRQAQAALRAMPVVDVPRSFRLRPADVVGLSPAHAPASASRMLRWSPAAAAAAITIFAVVLGADLATRDGSSRLATLESQQRTGTIMDESATFAEDAAKDSAPAPAMPPDTGGSSGAIQPPDTGTSIAAAGPSDASTQAPLAAAPTPAATQAPGESEAMVPATTDGSEASAPETGAGSAAPTGPAPDGDQYLPAPDVQLPPGTPVAGDDAAGSGAQPSLTPVRELTALASDDDQDGEGNRMAFRIVEIAAAVVAIVSGGTFVTWRLRRRENP